MQEKKIEITVSLTFQDILRNIFWQTFKKVWFIFLLALAFTPFFFVGVYSLIIAGKFGALIIMPAVPLFIVLIILFSIYSSAKKSFKSIKGDIKWVFTENGYETVTPIGTSQSNWEGLEEIKETTQDFLLYPQKPIFIVIPKRSFQNEIQMSEFKELVQENLGEKAKLKK